MLLTAPNFPSLLGQSLGDTFGSVFPAIPFAALLLLILALRWGELRDLLLKEEGWKSEPTTRVIGVGTIVALALLEPVTGQNVAAAGIAVVLTVYAASLAVNPLTKRFLLPYAAIYATGVGAPTVLQWAFGEPLAYLSSAISSRLIDVLGFPVAWHGTEFQFVSRTGGVISGVVAPGCSSIISVTTFLGLLALMHLDMKKDFRSTATLALAGIAALTILNAVRIMVLLWVGYVDGSAAFWGVHNWVGYAFFLGFYLAVLPVYSKMGRGPRAFPPMPEMPYTP
ncbi:MAG: exosortase/archaeosortase family protein [Nitrososphaerota archaeon]|nr:exosortase/archaeosortase family protein [Nitrososphaerota archaeon]